MKFKEIASRLTGFSTPVFGVSWNPPQAHITIARRVITYLEDRRVLYNPYHLEDPWQCVQSVLDMRKYLTSELGDLDTTGSMLKVILRQPCRLKTSKNNKTANEKINLHPPSVKHSSAR